MKIELYFSPGACSFVAHAGLEIVKAVNGQDFEPRLVKIHKGEQFAPEYLQMNPNAQVPVLVVDGKPLVQILAIIEWLAMRFPEAGLLPTDPWERAQAMSTLAWFNNTVHPTFTHVFRPSTFTDEEAAVPGIRQHAVGRYRALLERIDAMVPAQGLWMGDKPGFQDAYAFTLLRWSGYAGIDPTSLPRYAAYVERVMACPPIAAAMERERVKLDTFKAAA